MLYPHVSPAANHVDITLPIPLKPWSLGHRTVVSYAETVDL